VLDRIANALRGTPVVAAYLFGSRQSGRALADSDTDIAVLLPPGTEASLLLLGDLTLRLAETGVPSPEVHVLNEAPLALQAEALRGTRAFSSDEPARVTYEAWLTLRYLDFEPLLALQYRIQRRRLAEEGTLGHPSAFWVKRASSQSR
jgi:predicted nucleotidyltransferase